MGKWIYRKGKWIQDKVKSKIGFKSENTYSNYNWDTDKNVVKVIKPKIAYIPITITLGVYNPKTKELDGKKKMTINLSQIEKFCETTIYGKPEVKTALGIENLGVKIKQGNEYIYPLETWKELDDLCTAAVEKYTKKIIELLQQRKANK
jgi:hypothetical protein